MAFVACILSPSTKLPVCTAVICSTLTEEIEGFSGECVRLRAVPFNPVSDQEKYKLSFFHAENLSFLIEVSLSSVLEGLKNSLNQIIIKESLKGL